MKKFENQIATLQREAEQLLDAFDKVDRIWWGDAVLRCAKIYTAGIRGLCDALRAAPPALAKDALPFIADMCEKQEKALAHNMDAHRTTSAHFIADIENAVDACRWQKIQNAELAISPDYGSVFINGVAHRLTPRLSNLCRWAAGRDSFEFWEVPKDIRGGAGRLVKMFQNQYAILYTLLFDNMGGQQIRPKF